MKRTIKRRTEITIERVEILTINANRPDYVQRHEDREDPVHLPPSQNGMESDLELQRKKHKGEKE